MKIKIKHSLITQIIFSVIMLVAVFVLASCGEPKRSSEEIIQELVVTYAAHPDEAEKETAKLLKELKSADKEAYQKWSEIMDCWQSVNTDLQLNYDVLPDGLPDTDELGIVALGFQLMPDGTMKEELIERLKVVKSSAEKYPNALVICTGGGTAAGNKAVTEAGQMAKWLAANGIDESRIVVEDKSITTAQNAMLSYDIITEKYPQVSQLAIISSDYHIATGALLFEAESILRAKNAKKEKLPVVSNAAYKAPSGSLSTMFQAGALIELSGDTDTAFDIYYEDYDINDLPEID